MELSQLLNAGGIAGLAAGVSEVLFAVLFAGWFKNATAGEPRNQSNYPLQILLHLLSGVGIGLLFWLSWGFAALVRVDWWARGLLYAAALWSVCVAPCVLQLYLSQFLTARAAVVTLATRAYGLSVIGLACAWTWSVS